MPSQFPPILSTPTPLEILVKLHTYLQTHCWEIPIPSVGGSVDIFWNCTLCPFAGHKDSVTCTAFSHDSKLVATGDMSGLITVWDVATQKEVWNFETTDLEVRLQSYLLALF